jgi:hypothetical protein
MVVDILLGRSRENFCILTKLLIKYGADKDKIMTKTLFYIPIYVFVILLIGVDGLVVEDNRMIAYLGNWQSCPTIDKLAQYSHVVIAFAVSYTWSPSKNICSPTCEISTPPICNNGPNPNLINQLHQAGKKVILSFGGAGMGGSWSGDVNDCWEYCYGREEQVVNRLVDIVAGKFANVDRKPILWGPVCSRFGFV